MISAEFQYDVFLSRSAKDKAVVRPLGERLRQGKADCRRQKAEILHSAFILHPFLRAFVSDWAQLEAGTCGRRNLRFPDPLNQERRVISLRLDDAPIKGSLAQFLYINWRPADREQKGLKARKMIAQGKRSETSAALGQRAIEFRALTGRKKSVTVANRSPQ